ncbi:MAG: hypothetical protein HY917_02435 [Candidatus Diapherotrites archaeon]|nr:hypothetical protein [Candidatus Diapherotrites archaeon]
MAAPMKTKCPNCREKVELDVNRFEEGDDFECPECGANYLIGVKGGKLNLVSEKEKYFEEDEFGAEDEEESSYDDE